MKAPSIFLRIYNFYRKVTNPTAWNNFLEDALGLLVLAMFYIIVIAIMNAFKDVINLFIIIGVLYAIFLAFTITNKRDGWISIAGFVAYGTSWVIAAEINVWLGQAVCVAGVLAIFLSTVKIYRDFFWKINYLSAR